MKNTPSTSQFGLNRFAIILVGCQAVVDHVTTTPCATNVYIQGHLRIVIMQSQFFVTIRYWMIQHGEGTVGVQSFAKGRQQASSHHIDIIINERIQ